MKMFRKSSLDCEALRRWMIQTSVEGVAIPSWDGFLSEMAPPADRWLEAVSGFAGSNGIAVLMLEGKHWFYTDSRYLLEVSALLDPALWHPAVDMGALPWIEHWTKHHPGGSLATSAGWWTVEQGERMAKTAVDGGAVVRWAGPPETVLTWGDRPIRRAVRWWAYDAALSDRSIVQKVALWDGEREARPELTGTIVTDPSALSWALHLRAETQDCTPVVRARLVVCSEALHWFVELDAAVTVEDFLLSHPWLAEHLAPLGRPSDWHRLESLPGWLASQKGVWAYDPTSLTMDAMPLEGWARKDPVNQAKACKDLAEQRSMQRIHEDEGVAWARMLYALHRGELADEYAVGACLQKARMASSADYVGDSFPTIAGSDGRGAIIHYRPPLVGSYALAGASTLLVDSGGQYRGGTTDATRSLVLKAPVDPSYQQAYTAVLRGHVALATAIFPASATGAMLDAIARAPLWKLCYQVPHGIGHGVGHCLSVHEFPPSISARHHSPLELGMVVSNEPGWYRPDADGIPGFGIRLETMLLVVPGPFEGWLSFETLTLIPYDFRAVLWESLTCEERGWLSAYHQRLMERIHPRLLFDPALAEFYQKLCEKFLVEKPKISQSIID
jgi:Xaa-Pro aminopeptidase